MKSQIDYLGNYHLETDYVRAAHTIVIKVTSDDFAGGTTYSTTVESFPGKKFIATGIGVYSTLTTGGGGSVDVKLKFSDTQLRFGRKATSDGSGAVEFTTFCRWGDTLKGYAFSDKIDLTIELSDVPDPDTYIVIVLPGILVSKNENVSP